MKAGSEFLLHGKNRRLVSKSREENCGTHEVCCAVTLSKNGFISLAYQSRGTGDAVICDRDDGHLW